MDMKLNFGSIQRKGSRLYLVVRRDGRQQWLSLKTANVATARKRAMELMMPTRNEDEWLQHLTALGRSAELRLKRIRLNSELGWDGVFDAFLASEGSGVPKKSSDCYARWLELLKAEVKGLRIADIDGRCAQAVVESLSKRYISCRRMVGFYRRCWKALGLDDSIWEMKCRHLAMDDCACGKDREFYRRLSVDEIRRLYRHLSGNSPDLADMVAIGYATGLRLSDVAELDTSEVSQDGRCLRIVPNKTSGHKPKPLSIPLLHEAAAVVSRRMLEAAGGRNRRNGGAFLFPAESRHRPSRRITAAFRRCGICKEGNARASFHSLRATFISMMDEAGVSPHLTDSVTGHAGGGMHARYSQPSLASVRAAMLSAIPPLGPIELETPVKCRCGKPAMPQRGLDEVSGPTVNRPGHNES